MILGLVLLVNTSMSAGSSPTDELLGMFRRAADDGDRIAKGVTPANLSVTRSLLFRARQKAKSMTAFQIVVGCLAASILLALIALIVAIREHVSTRTTADTAHLGLPAKRGDSDIASAPVARLAELGWAVQQLKDGYQFSANTRLPDMKEAAAYFRQLDRPFQLQLQGLKNLDGLHLIADVPTCKPSRRSGGYSNGRD
jgi:hypothetical protein